MYTSLTDKKISLNAYIQRIATGPEMSKDLSLQDTREAMRHILEGSAHPVQAAVFLIALRMKRETDDENNGILEAIRDKTQAAFADVEDLLDIFDPYDGFLRHLPASPFLPGVLAASGLPTVSHGLKAVGPKYGVTHHQVLNAAGINTDNSPEQAAKRISDSQIGWAYVDQNQYCPQLHNLVELRNLIIKRPCLNTIEGFSGPVRTQGRTHLLNGYVHRGYKRTYLELARHAGYHSALLIRGIEGSVVPLLNKSVSCVSYYETQDPQEFELDPALLNISSEVRATPVPDEARTNGPKSIDTESMARIAAETGIKALEGAPGPTRNSLIFTAAACLVHCQRFKTYKDAGNAIKDILDTGKALNHFRAT